MASGAMVIRALREADSAVIAAAFSVIGWNKPVEQFRRYLGEQALGTRNVFVLTSDEEFAGYVTLNWQPTYPTFKGQGIPEIQDLNVLPAYRRRGVGSALLEAAERRAAEAVRAVGIRVGLDQGYAAAQRLYVRRGYVPDGRGLAQGDRAVAFGEYIVVNHDLVLSFTKQL